jgi:hypothetical protein
MAAAAGSLTVEHMMWSGAAGANSSSPKGSGSPRLPSCTLVICGQGGTVVEIGESHPNPNERLQFRLPGRSRIRRGSVFLPIYVLAQGEYLAGGTDDLLHARGDLHVEVSKPTREGRFDYLLVESAGF